MLGLSFSFGLLRMRLKRVGFGGLRMFFWGFTLGRGFSLYGIAFIVF